MSACPAIRGCRLPVRGTGFAAGWLLGFFALTTAPIRALDFRLQSTSVEEDGFKREQWFFQHDVQTRVMISLPGGWSHADEADSLTLTPPNITHGMVRIEKSNIGPGVSFDGPTLEVYRKKMLAGIPQGATALRLGAESTNPLPIFGWKSHEFTADYELFGQSYRRSVLFLDLNAKEQVVMTIVGLKGDFDRVYATGMDVLRSWQVMPVR